MSAIWSLGFGDVVLPLVFWVPLFFAVTLIANLLVVRACRRRLRARGHDTAWPTTLLVVPLCVLGPIFAGCLGAPFSLERSAGCVLERGGRELAGRAASFGERPARELLGVRGDEDPVELAPARKLLEARIRRADDAREHGAWAAIKQVPELFERAYFGALVVASYTFPVERAVPFGELARRARKPFELGGAHVPGLDLLQRSADRCYAGARATLYTWLLLLAAADGLAFAVVHLASRRRAAAAPSKAA
ncbi:MAG TPA: hypothetical protein VFF06_22645 [Polyangia bacterium]|nr:hypothetical protein [Polyangia bacterium]